MTFKEARKHLGLTQIEVEKMFGVPTRTQQNWENGTRKAPEYVDKCVIKVMLQECQKKQSARVIVTDKRVILELLKDGAWVHHYAAEICDGQVPAEALKEIGKLVDDGCSLHFA